MSHAYRLISADTHVNEPPDLWTSRVAARFRDRVPRIERFDAGDAWVIEGVADPINFGMNACAGLDPAEQRGWVRFEDIRAGGYDPRARLVEMDKDGVDAEVVYPTPRLSQGVAANPDVELHQAMISAYNDWLSEYVAHAPARFGGLAMIPNRGCDGAVSEIDRVWGRPGIRGFLMTAYPNATLEPAPADDKVWAAITERGASLNVHVSLTLSMPAAHRSPLPGYGRFFDAPNRIVQLIFAGVFDRFPELQVVFAEVDSGWVPYFKEHYRRQLPPPAPDERLHDPGPPERVRGPPRLDEFHQRRLRRALPPRHRRRKDAVVERLPAHQRQLAQHPPAVAGHVLRSPAGGGVPHAGGQRRPALWLLMGRRQPSGGDGAVGAAASPP